MASFDTLPPAATQELGVIGHLKTDSHHMSLIQKRIRVLGIVLILAACIVNSTFIFRYAKETPVFSVDSYSYLAKAESLSRGEGLSVNWGIGRDRKYFPGYSVFLAPFAFFGENGGDYWIWANILNYFALALLVWFLARQLGFDGVWRALITLGVVTHPTLIRWIFLPYGELLCVTLCVAAWILFLKEGRRKTNLFCSSLLVGAAVMVRPEAVMFLGVFFALGVCGKERTPLLRILPAVGICLVLFAWWYLSTPPVEEDTSRLVYLDAYREAPVSGHQLVDNFDFFVHSLTQNFWRSPPAYQWFAAATKIWGAAAIVMALLGFLGIPAVAEAFAFLAFCLGHSFWFYVYDRYMIIAIPVFVLLQFRLLKYACEKSPFLKSKRDRMLPGIVVLAILFGTNLDRGRRAELQMSEAYAYNHGVETPYIQIAAQAKESLPDNRKILTNGGPYIAYYFSGEKVYFSSAERHYYNSDIHPGSAMEEMTQLKISHLLLLRTDFERWHREMGLHKEVKELFKEIASGPGWQLFTFNRLRHRGENEVELQ